MFLKQIRDAQCQRIVRPDDSEFDFLFLREREEFRQIIRAEIDASDNGIVFREPFLRDAGVARRAPHLRGVRRLREFPDQRVFASARTDDKDFHVKAGRRLRRSPRRSNAKTGGLRGLKHSKIT